MMCATYRHVARLTHIEGTGERIIWREEEGERREERGGRVDTERGAERGARAEQSAQNK